MRSVRILLSALAAITLATGSAAWAQSGPVPGIPFIYQARDFRDLAGNVTIRFLGNFPVVSPDSCWRAEPVSDSPPVLRLAPGACEDSSGVPPDTWSWVFGLGRLAPGHHTVLITVLLERTPIEAGPIVYQGYYSFDIPRDSIPTGLPYVDQVRIEPAYADSSSPICPGDSIRVTLSGDFPTPCFSLKKIEILDIAMTPVPGPPVIGLIVDRGGCLDCPEVLTPWNASVVLPPQRAGAYHQILQMTEVDCGLPDSVVARNTAAVPFVVNECPPPLECLWPGFDHPNGLDACDAFLTPERTARVTFNLRTTVALAGLQGRFFLEPSKLRIVSIQPVGPALGMHLNWAPTENGARFTMFAESGAPIPACGDDVLDPTRCRPLPVIDVTLAALDPEVPGETWVNVTELLGSDVFGNGVRICPFRFDDPSRLVSMGARVCSEPGCDFNTDGRTDVRDLVLMVHCVNDPIHCSIPTIDCNGDSTRSIEDVICCAIHMLREGSICPECPPDTTRPAPHVRGTMGAPVISESSIEIPVTLIGAEFLGGAVLEFDYPADRYDVDVSLNNGSGIWLELDQLRSGKLAVGLVRTSPLITLDVDQRLNMTMRFTLKPGQTAGGDFAYARGEFSGWDGTLLEVDLGSLSQTLGTGAQLQLSEPRPNPTAGETRFSVTLDRESEVEIGVYDLNGRRVATVHRGMLTAGPHEFTWQGRNDQGSAVPNGIYFYRATGYGNSVTRKLVMLRGR